MLSEPHVMSSWLKCLLWKCRARRLWTTTRFIKWSKQKFDWYSIMLMLVSRDRRNEDKDYNKQVCSYGCAVLKKHKKKSFMYSWKHIIIHIYIKKTCDVISLTVRHFNGTLGLLAKSQKRDILKKKNIITFLIGINCAEETFIKICKKYIYILYFLFS